MAIVLNFNLLCKELIDLNAILQSTAVANLDASIEKISCIDNWMWENQQEVQEVSLIQKKLLEGKIVIINLKSSIVKDLGIYVKKTAEKYVYDMWVNTEGYSELDADEINLKNKKYFERFYQIFDDLVKNQNIKFQILGIGLETKFEYRETIIETIKKSDNVITWIVNKNLGKKLVLDNYVKRKETGMDFWIFERWDFSPDFVGW